MPVNLYISRYPEKDKARLSELDECLRRNIECAAIDQVFILAEDVENLVLPEHEKVIVLPVTARPTYQMFFKAINATSAPSDINIVANSDIYFNDLPALPKQNQVFCLTRYEVRENGAIEFLNRNDSQDCIVFPGHVRIPAYCSFALGRPGCDNRISRELSVTGYQVLNPSLTIKTFHLHAGQKSYDNLTKRVPPPYLRLTPTLI